MSHPPIGIDLGTTNSLISVFEDGRPRLIPNAAGEALTPSVVGLDNDKRVIVGDAARSRLLTAPESTFAHFKRTMGADRKFRLGRQTVSSEDLSALVLRSLKQDAEAELGCEIKDVVVSVPAYFNEIQRRAVKNACAISGLTPLRLINEPTAAALAYGLHERDQETTFLVFDLGGGTFDVALLEIFEGVFEVRASSGDAALGGEDFTKVIADHFETTLAETSRLGSDMDKAALRNAAERAKLALSKSETAELTVRLETGEANVSLDRYELEELSGTLLKRLRRPVERCLHDAGIALDDIDNVLLVGGATRMPAIRSFAARTFGRLPAGHIDPDHVVALGAAVQAAFVAKDQALEDLVMTDVTAFSMGVSTSREMRGGWVDGFYAPVIERNSTVPISRETTIRAAKVGQRDMPVSIYQGEAPMVEDNLPLGSFVMPLPYNREAKEAVRVRFTYDVSGLLEVEAESISQGYKQSIVIQGGAEILSESEVKARLKKLEGLKTHPRDEADNIALVERLNEAYAMALADERRQIQDLLHEFEEYLAAQDTAVISRERKRIAQFLKAFEDAYVR